LCKKNILDYLPSKKIVFVAVPLFALVVLVFFVTRPDGVAPARVVVNASPQGSSSNLLDDDGDGLKNWEEELWGTNPKIADTDGDGTPDGEETLAGRNPLVAGPDDKITEENKKGVLSKNSEALTSQTDLFAENYYLAFLEGKTADSSYSFNETLFNYLEKPLGEKTALSELRTVTTSKETVRLYGNRLGEVFKEYAFKESVLENELSIIGRALENENPEILALLKNNINLYSEFAKKLKGISVPKSAVQTHLNLIHGYEDIAFSLQVSQKIIIDPLTGASGFEQYNIAISNVGGAIDDLRTYMILRGVQFTQKESGYYVFSI